jgi:DNA-binding transcriptional ArsR family regulator
MAPFNRSDEDKLLIALRHPLRRLILREMADGTAISPRELSTALRQPLSNVSYHVRVLAAHDAVTLVEAKQRRGTVQHFYRRAAMAPWARQMLEAGEIDGGGAGESSGGDPLEPREGR